jgi:hypothetical protein
MPTNEYNSDRVILAHFINTGEPTREGNEHFTAVDLTAAFATRGNFYTFHDVKSACYKTLEALHPGSHSPQMMCVKIVWEIDMPNGRPAAETVLKDDRLHGPLLDALFNRKGLGYLKVYYADTPSPLPESAHQRLGRSSVPPAYSE